MAGPIEREVFAIFTMLRQPVTLAVLVASACAPAGNNDSAVKIYGGAPAAQGDWPSTVALIIQSPSGQSLCSGTLVAPQLVVTAAHCFVDDGTQAAPPISGWSIIFGNDVTNGTTVTATKGNWNPAYKNTAVNDIAYLVLAEPQANVAIIQPATATAEITKLVTPGAAATIVGFGTTESKALGTKYQATTVVGADQDGAMFIGGSGKDTCQGDSGGPAFGQVNGQWRVFGVTSRGAGCGNGGSYARLYDGLCWVEQDSGIKLAGSQLPCDGGKTTAANGTGYGAAGVVGTDLQALLGPPQDSSDETFEFDVAGPQTVAKVSMCFGALAACVQSQHEDLGTVSVSGPNASRAYFATSQSMKLLQPSVVTILGFDANGTLTEARGLSLTK